MDGHQLGVGESWLEMPGVGPLGKQQLQPDWVVSSAVTQWAETSVMNQNGSLPLLSMKLD